MGVLGRAVCAMLARDFDAFSSRARLEIGGRFYQFYNRWRDTFRMVAANGALRFDYAINDDEACRHCGITDAEMHRQPLEPVESFRHWVAEDLCSACALTHTSVLSYHNTHATL